MFVNRTLLPSKSNSSSINSLLAFFDIEFSHRTEMQILRQKKRNKKTSINVIPICFLLVTKETLFAVLYVFFLDCLFAVLSHTYYPISASMLVEFFFFFFFFSNTRVPMIWICGCVFVRSQDENVRMPTIDLKSRAYHRWVNFQIQLYLRVIPEVHKLRLMEKKQLRLQLLRCQLLLAEVRACHRVIPICNFLLFFYLRIMLVYLLKTNKSLMTVLFYFQVIVLDRQLKVEIIVLLKNQQIVIVQQLMMSMISNESND